MGEKNCILNSRRIKWYTNKVAHNTTVLIKTHYCVLLTTPCRKKSCATLCSVLYLHIVFFFGECWCSIRRFLPTGSINIVFDRIFHMLEDIISVAIFSLLPPNSIFMSICMYEVEVVCAFWTIQIYSKQWPNWPYILFFLVFYKFRTTISTIRRILFASRIILASFSL